jgi:hypothetical protein
MGPQQGDPLGPLLFSLGIHPILESLTSDLIAGYLDDVTIGGALNSVADDVGRVVQAAGELGLTLNPSKCEVICPPGVDVSQLPDFPAVFDGFKFVEVESASLLGSPLLPGAGLDDALKSRCDDFGRAIGRLKLLPAHVALTMIRNALGVPKLMYLLRTSPCGGNAALDIFDDLMHDGLEHILNISLSSDQWLQATLPIRDGGLGIRRVVSLAPSAFLASAASTLDLQNKITPSCSAFSDPNVARATQDWCSLSGSVPLVGTAAFIQRSWDAPCVAVTRNRILLSCSDDVQRARVLASLAPHTGDWLQALPIASCGLLMDNEVIRTAVGFRLGCTLCSPHDCPCGKLVDATGIHCLACRKSSGRQMRHSQINDIIWRALARAKIQAVKEPQGLIRGDGKRPDGLTLIPWQRGKCLAWDATVPDTLAASHLAWTSLIAGSAAERAAEAKTAKYASIAQSHIFLPLAIETLGVWNADGDSFLCDLGSKICDITGDPRETSFLFQRLSVAVQRGNAASFSGSFADLVPPWD